MLLYIGKNLIQVRCRQTSVVCSKYIWGIQGVVPAEEIFAIFTII